MRHIMSLFLLFTLTVVSSSAQDQDIGVSTAQKWVFAFVWFISRELHDQWRNHRLSQSKNRVKKCLFFLAKKWSWDYTNFHQKCLLSCWYRGSHKCPQDPSFSCNDDQTCCLLPKGEVPSILIPNCCLLPKGKGMNVWTPISKVVQPPRFPLQCFW